MASSPGAALRDGTRQCVTLQIPRAVDGLLSPAGVPTPTRLCSAPHLTVSPPTLEGEEHTVFLPATCAISACVFTHVQVGKRKKERNGSKSRLHLRKSVPLEPWAKQYVSSHLKRAISSIPALRNCSESLYAVLHAWKKQGSAGDTHCLPSSEHQLWLSSVG